MNERLLTRFLKYVSFNTMSQDNGLRPSSPGQEELMLYIKKELEALGAETYYGEEKVLSAFIPGSGKPIAFMAHVDVADDVPGNNVRPVVHKDFIPQDIILEHGVISLEENPDLRLYQGGTIITSSGDTLLGSDDKAGIAIILEAAERLLGMPHRSIELYFTPDEEIGRGLDSFPFDKMKADICYTVDGEEEGFAEAECFNAASVHIDIKGKAVHLGSARGVLKSAVTAAAFIISSLPGSESPEATDGRYGYYTADNLRASIERASFDVIIRDFDYPALERRIRAVKTLAESASLLYGVEAEAKAVISYRNMAEAIRKKPEAMGILMRAAAEAGIKLEERAIRGGTDGARLAEASIASPNIFTGGHNLHSRSEWIALEAMERASDLLVRIAKEDA